jgi:trk system potassium uptake protein TrkH
MQPAHHHKINPLNASGDKRSNILTPARILCFSFLAVILTGTFLLCLPISSKSGAFTPIIDSMFTATTSTCVTGLVIYDTFTHWSIFGQVVILMLIQVGGLGLVTLTTFFMVLFKQKIGLSNMTLAQESAGSDTLINLFSLIKLVVISTLTVEMTGAVLLATRFIPKYGAEGIWISVFTAISAYCNAGIDLLGREAQFASLTNYVNDPVVCITVMLLIIIGGLGFIVFQDVLTYKKRKKLMLHTKTVLFTTGKPFASTALSFVK